MPGMDMEDFDKIEKNNSKNGEKNNRILKNFCT
jgi:hypothetical protein